MGVYTRSGDKGETGLVGGTRVSKSDQRLDLYGTVDELNSFLGLAISHIEVKGRVEFLRSIQSRLFDLGSNLACESEKRAEFNLPKIEPSWTKALEQEIDELSKTLAELKNFILPGGNQASSCLHICRTICRRLEREMISYANKNTGELPENSIEFVNRLSDYFFVMARKVNNQEEVIWKASTSS